MNADGYEDRAFEASEAYERDIDDADVAEQLADEAEPTDTRIPVRCVVRDHDWHLVTHHCQRCGNHRNDELNQTRVWL